MAMPGPGVSASAFADDRRRALEAGMDDFAPKPIELNGLRAVLRKFIPGYEPLEGRKPESSAA
jgi:CheY-like chemotaxis protein